jgi:hypothetical protein
VRFRATRLELAGTLTGLEGIQQGRNLKITPFITSRLTTTRASDSTATDKDLDGGFDLKYSLTPSLTFDGTYRTDFAQVEADQQQVNLTRFNLFFPEKRSFFLENAGVFNFGRGGNLVPFFSRSIGLGRSGTAIPAGAPVPIVGGARVTGQLERFNVGVLAMRTESVDGASATLPANNYIVGRARRSLLRNSYVGALVTNRTSTQSGDYNRVYGADARFEFSRLFFDAYLLKSDTPAVTEKDRANKVQGGWVDDEFSITAERSVVQTNFNPEMGFVRRGDMEQCTWARLRGAR